MGRWACQLVMGVPKFAGRFQGKSHLWPSDACHPLGIREKSYDEIDGVFLQAIVGRGNCYSLVDYLPIQRCFASILMLRRVSLCNFSIGHLQVFFGNFQALFHMSSVKKPLKRSPTHHGFDGDFHHGFWSSQVHSAIGRRVIKQLQNDHICNRQPFLWSSRNFLTSWSWRKHNRVTLGATKTLRFTISA